MTKKKRKRLIQNTEKTRFSISQNNIGIGVYLQYIVVCEFIIEKIFFLRVDGLDRVYGKDIGDKTY